MTEFKRTTQAVDEFFSCTHGACCAIRAFVSNPGRDTSYHKPNLRIEALVQSLLDGTNGDLQHLGELIGKTGGIRYPLVA
jgi:hypothetical protein